MASSDIRDDLEPVLNLTPLVQAADTIRSYCLKYETCNECPFHNVSGRGIGCYFNITPPEEWDVGGIIYQKTEDIGKKHKSKPRKNKGGS